MESFVKVFAAGVGLVLLSVLFSGMGQLPGMSWGSSTNVVFTKTSLFLGGEAIQNLRHTTLGDFAVGNALRNKTEEVNEIMVYNGLLRGNSQSFDFSGIDAEHAFVDFDLKETNNYGDLIIRLNEEVVWRGRPVSGRQTVELTGFGESNTVDVLAANSGLRMWAPTIYSMNDLKMITSSFENIEVVKEFKAFPHEVDGWDFSRIIIPVEESVTEGNMIIEVNDRQVYNGTPREGSLPQQIDFSKNDVMIEEGINTIKFVTEQNGVYSLRNVDVITFFYAGGLDSDVSTFYIVGKNIGLLDKENTIGVLEFDARTDVTSALNIYINDNQLEFDVQKGNNLVEFSKEFLYKNENEIRIETYGNYDLRSIRLTIDTNSTKKSLI